MRKIVLYYSVIATVLLIIMCAYLHHSQGEIARLRNNNEALASDVELYKTRHNESAASVVALQLRLDEFRRQHARDAEQIRTLGIRLRRAESISTSATKSEVVLSAPLTSDTVQLFKWSDRWISIEGCIRAESVDCKIESIDTLHQIIHRVPHRWWFFRYGTKAIRQEITSSNPHTQVVYAEYIELPKRHRRR